MHWIPHTGGFTFSHKIGFKEKRVLSKDIPESMRRCYREFLIGTMFLFTVTSVEIVSAAGAKEYEDEEGTRG